MLCEWFLFHRLQNVIGILFLFRFVSLKRIHFPQKKVFLFQIEWTEPQDSERWRKGRQNIRTKFSRMNFTHECHYFHFYYLHCHFNRKLTVSCITIAWPTKKNISTEYKNSMLVFSFLGVWNMKQETIETRHRPVMITFFSTIQSITAH